MGDTDLCEEAVSNLLVWLGREFAGNRYHLLERNCNTFSEAFVRKLTGRPGSVPGWVNRVARLGSLLNTVAPCVLPAAVRMIADTPSAPPLSPTGSTGEPARRPAPAVHGAVRRHPL